MEELSPVGTQRAVGVGRSWKVTAAVASIMVVLAMIGVGLTTIDRPLARRYWMFLVPAYGVLCMAIAWIRSRHDALHGLGAVGQQLAHWLAIGAAVALDFWMTGTGEETGAAAGFNALLLLAVGCVLAGVYLDWHFGLVGGLLALSLVSVVKIDQYLWLLLVVAALVLAVIYTVARLMGRSSAAGDSPAADGR